MTTGESAAIAYDATVGTDEGGTFDALAFGRDEVERMRRKVAKAEADLAAAQAALAASEAALAALEG